jgi:hypothetical protein
MLPAHAAAATPDGRPLLTERASMHALPTLIASSEEVSDCSRESMRDCDTALQHSECCQRTQQRRPPMGARCSPFARAAPMMKCGCCCCRAAWANVLESDCTHSPCVFIPHSGMTDAHTAITAGRSWQFRPESWWLFPPLHTVTVGSLPRIHARMHRMLCAPPPPSLEEQWAALSALRQRLPARVPPHGPSWPHVREADPTHTH